MSNTVIQLKYSTVTATPPSLNVGEAAYSFSSDKLFIGNTTNGVLTIGGKYYTDKIDAATHLATPSTLVSRDSNGDIYANSIYANITGTIVGNAATASKWLAPIDIGLAGDATGNVSVDGSANVTLTVDLSDTGVVAGTYGGSANVPYFTVDAEGRLTAAGNTAISTALSVAGDSGTGSLNLLTDSLTVAGRDGVTTTFVDSNNTVIVDVDNTVIRTTGNQTINGDLSVTGNLFLTGNTTLINVTTFEVEDSLIYLAGNNYTSDIVDIGFVGNYFDGSTQRHAGFFREAASNSFYAFVGYTPEPDQTVDINHASFQLANVHANITQGTVSGLAAAIVVADGGTGANTFASGQILVGNGTGALQSLANTGTAGTYGSATVVPVITTDAYGRVSGVTNTSIVLPTIANGSYYLTISGTDGQVSTNGSSFLLKNGAVLKDTSGDAVAFGQDAGTLSQGQQAVAIGDSAGYNTQGAYSVAIGYGAGNISQGQQAVAIGINAGIANQGLYGVAVGSSAGSNQGTGAIAIGYDSGGAAANYSIALGHQALKGNTSGAGANTVAIGHKAGFESAFAGSILLNATGNNLSSAVAGLYVDPIRVVTTDGDDKVMFYNSVTKEVRSSGTLSGGTF